MANPVNNDLRDAALAVGRFAGRFVIDRRRQAIERAGTGFVRRIGQRERTGGRVGAVGQGDLGVDLERGFGSEVTDLGRQRLGERRHGLGLRA